MSENTYPDGWDEDRVKALVNHYESQTENEAIAEDQAAYESTTHTVMSVPVDLVPQIRDFIANHQQ